MFRGLRRTKREVERLDAYGIYHTRAHTWGFPYNIRRTSILFLTIVPRNTRGGPVFCTGVLFASLGTLGYDFCRTLTTRTLVL